MAEEYNWLTKEGLKFVPEDVAQDANKNGWAQLQNAAIKFLHNVEVLSITKQQYEEKVKRGFAFLQPGRGLNSGLSLVYEEMRKSQQLTRDLINQQYLFEQALNRFLGRTISLAWVSFETGELIIASSLQERQIYNHLATRNKGRGNLSFRKELVNQLRQNMEKEMTNPKETLEKELLRLIKEREDKYKALFLQVKTRWEMNHTKPTAWTDYWWKEYRDTLWWRTGWRQGTFNKYTYGHSTKINRGYISEAYVNLIMGNDKGTKFFLPLSSYGLGLEQNVLRYWEYMQQSRSVNPIPGVVSGDVKLSLNNSNGSIQFSVKSTQSFSTAKIGPYIQIAYVLASIDFSELTVEDVQQLLNKINGNFDYETRVTKEAKKVAEDRINASLQSNGYQLI